MININHQLKVAFVDIGERHLNKGDVVKVQNGYQTMVHMEVLEASAVISKIGIGSVVRKGFRSKDSDFDEITIGEYG